MLLRPELGQEADYSTLPDFLDELNVLLLQEREGEPASKGMK